MSETVEPNSASPSPIAQTPTRPRINSQMSTKSHSESILVALQSHGSSRRASNMSGFQNLKLDANGDDETIKGDEQFAMIPSLRNSLRSSIHSIKGKKRSISKDINSIMEIYDLISVKDFGYPASNPLHYGLSNYELYLNNQSASQLDGYYNLGYFGGGGAIGSSVSESTAANSVDLSAAAVAAASSAPESEPSARAIALFPFHAENDNELELRENQIINILYRHGQGWLVGEDPESGNTGLIPEEFVELIFDQDEIYKEDLEEPEISEEIDNDVFYNAKSQLGSPTESQARTTLIPRQQQQNQQNKHKNHTPSISNNTKDSSSEASHLESESSDLQIDNAELKPFLPEIFRTNGSPSSMTNSLSYSRIQTRSFSSGSNSLMKHSSSLNSNLNLSFSRGSPKTAFIGRRGSILFGGGLIQSKSTNSINMKLGGFPSTMSMPRSVSLSRSFGGIGEEFRAPNLLSKDNYFGQNISALSENTSEKASDDDFWVDEEFREFEKSFEKSSPETSSPMMTKSITMKSIREESRGFTRVLSRKFSRIRMR